MCVSGAVRAGPDVRGIAESTRTHTETRTLPPLRPFSAHTHTHCSVRRLSPSLCLPACLPAASRRTPRLWARLRARTVVRAPPPPLRVFHPGLSVCSRAGLGLHLRGLRPGLSRPSIRPSASVVLRVRLRARRFAASAASESRPTVCLSPLARGLLGSVTGPAAGIRASPPQPARPPTARPGPPTITPPSPPPPPLP